MYAPKRAAASSIAQLVNHPVSLKRARIEPVDF